MANKINIIAGLYQAFAHEQIAGADTVKQLSSSKYLSGEEYAKRAVITVDTDGSIRYTYDGTNPTTTAGHLANPTDAIVLIGSDNIINFKFINETVATNAEINVTYEK